MSTTNSLVKCFISPNVSDSNGEAANVVDAVDAGAQALSRLVGALDRLGLNDRNTNMGAIELLAHEVKDGSVQIAGALLALADAVREHGNKTP